jgi:peptidoglycan glycosyltransferase
MTDARKNIRFLIFVFILLFAAMIFYLVYAISVYGDRWFASPNNPRIGSVKGDVQAGAINDRNGEKLAWSENEDRKYAGDSDLRAAVSHVVGDTYGMTRGAESFYAKYLYGFSEDAVERFSDVLTGQKRRGSDIWLTIDANLSKTILNDMGDRKGAAVLLNYKTGEILASVSNPAFDPYKIKDYTGKEDSTALFDRATMGRYPPGSTFKVITAAAALENPELELENHDCKGKTEIGGQEVQCAGETAHGEVDLTKAFYKSCNTYFATQAVKLTGDVLKKEADKFGFNVDFMFEDMVAYKSVYDEPASEIDTAWSGVGQYKDLLTPLHAAMIAGSVANGGVMMEPKLLKSAQSPSGTVLYGVQPKVYRTPVTTDIAGKLKELMLGVVTKGTGTGAKVSGLKIGGKTGTAEYTDDKGKKKEHAWFIGFIDSDKHPLAVAVLLEGAGGGGKYAAPIAGNAFEKAVDLGY